MAELSVDLRAGGYLPGMESTLGHLESTVNHALALHRDDVIDEVCDWLESPEGREAVRTIGASAGYAGAAAAAVTREHFGRG